jgi:hypothetical protein
VIGDIDIDDGVTCALALGGNCNTNIEDMIHKNSLKQSFAWRHLGQQQHQQHDESEPYAPKFSMMQSGKSSFANLPSPSVSINLSL